MRKEDAAGARGPILEAALPSGLDPEVLLLASFALAQRQSSAERSQQGG